MQATFIRALFLALCLISPSAFAAIALPLQGYCRPGRYFPIQVDGSDTATNLQFTADGCLPTQMQPAAVPRRIVPMLATGFPTSLQIKTDVIPLRMPADNERLIASTLTDISAAIPLFPGQRLLPIHLDPTDPLPGPPAGWETLDAILLEADALSRITDNQRSAFLAGGVMLICTGDSPPDSRWSWLRRGQLWVLADNPAGPVAEVVNEDAYDPTYAWAPGWPATTRGQVMGVAALLIIIVIALLLRPNRWTFGAAIALPILATTAIGAWRASLGTITRAGGDVVVVHGKLIQHDAWVYERSGESADQSVNWSSWTHPIFASDAAVGNSQMKLIVTSQGDLQFTYAAAASHTMAFVRREVLPAESPTASMPVDSPMLDLARSVYLQHGDRIVGQIPAQPGRWPTVLINQQP